MKRFLVVLMTIALIFGVVGCGGGNSGKPEGTGKETSAKEKEETKSTADIEEEKPIESAAIAGTKPEPNLIEKEFHELKFSYPEEWEFTSEAEDSRTLNIIDNGKKTGAIVLTVKPNERDIYTNKDLEKYIPGFCSILGLSSKLYADLIIDNESIGGKKAMGIHLRKGNYYVFEDLSLEAYATIMNDKTYNIIYLSPEYDKELFSDFRDTLIFTKPELPEEEIIKLANARYAEEERAAAEGKAEEERAAAEEAEQLYKETKERLAEALTITSVSTGKPNSADGVDISVKWSNNSDKEIKYITFRIEPYNAVDDRVGCKIRKNSGFYLKATGPFEKGGNNTSFEECAWYNKDIVKAKITDIEIKYMDGTKEDFDGSRINYEWIQ